MDGREALGRRQEGEFWRVGGSLSGQGGNWAGEAQGGRQGGQEGGQRRLGWSA